MNPYLSIIIPTYNEALRIGPTLMAVSDYVKSKDFTYEIIIVDDGSRDETVRELEKYRSLFVAYGVLENKVNMGKGYSVKRGMLAARGEYRLFMDADLSVKMSNLERFVEEIQKDADIVIASIELPGATMQDDNSAYRRILGKWAKWLIRSLATPGIYDTQRGFKLFTAAATEAVFPPLFTYRWGFDIEVVRRAQKGGLKIKEIPVEWNNSRAAAVGLGSYFRTLIELFKIVLCV